MFLKAKLKMEMFVCKFLPLNTRNLKAFAIWPGLLQSLFLFYFMAIIAGVLFVYLQEQNKFLQIIKLISFVMLDAKYVLLYAQ